jgi:hypothetical protein
MIFDKKTTMFLVDVENDTMINYGTKQEMILQMDESHGNLFVVSYENLTENMKFQFVFENMLSKAYEEEE